MISNSKKEHGSQNDDVETSVSQNIQTDEINDENREQSPEIYSSGTLLEHIDFTEFFIYLWINHVLLWHLMAAAVRNIL